MELSLDDEVICGHLVTSQTKKLWSIQMDISSKLIEVCNKYGIRLWAEGGTLLGAVRHHGYIPWDDDIDFVMMRNDYEKFKEIGPSEFHDPFFFQSFNTDNWGGGLVRICRTDTTMIDDRYKLLKNRNYGFFIDVIVMDGIPDNERFFVREYRKVELMMRLLGRYCEYKSDYTNLRAIIRTIAVKLLFTVLNPQTIHDKVIELLSNYDINNNQLCAKLQLESRFCIGPKAINLRRCSWYSDTVWLPFFNMMLPAPKEWDKVLVSQFGEEYMTPKKDPNWHRIAIIDTDTPYSEILKELERES